MERIELSEPTQAYTPAVILAQVAEDIRARAARIPEYPDKLKAQQEEAELDREALEIAATHIEALLRPRVWGERIVVIFFLFAAGFVCGMLAAGVGR